MSERPRRSRFSFSLRSLLVLITLLCIAGGVGTIWRKRSLAFMDRSRHHAEIARRFANSAWGISRFSGFSEEANAEAQPLWEAHARHQALADHYRRASWFPFFPLEELELSPEDAQ
jgi:hypothetical protein